VEIFDSICSDCKRSSAKFEILVSLNLKYAIIGSHSHAACSPHCIVVQRNLIKLLHPITSFALRCVFFTSTATSTSCLRLSRTRMKNWPLNGREKIVFVSSDCVISVGGFSGRELDRVDDHSMDSAEQCCSLCSPTDGLCQNYRLADVWGCVRMPQSSWFLAVYLMSSHSQIMSKGKVLNYAWKKALFLL